MACRRICAPHTGVPQLRDRMSTGYLCLVNSEHCTAAHGAQTGIVASKKVGKKACCARISGGYTVYKVSLRLLNGTQTLKAA
jgi:hypothetical protein